MRWSKTRDINGVSHKTKAALHAVCTIRYGYLLVVLRPVLNKHIRISVPKHPR